MAKFSAKFKIIVEKFIVCLAGVIFLLVILEISLRIIGVFNLGESDSRLLTYRNNNSYIILCLGDSWTAGIGAPYGKDYPKQLESLLNSKTTGNDFKIINRGRGAHNTAQIMDELNMVLEQNIKPDLAIFLGGEANDWNYWGLHNYLKYNNFVSIINDYFYRIRVYKLIKLLFLNTKDKLSRLQTKDRYSAGFIDDRAQDGINERANNFMRDSAKHTPTYLDPYREGLFCRSQQRYEEAIQWFKKSLVMNPKAVDSYCQIGWVYKDQQKYDEAIQWFKKGIEADPGSAAPYAGIGWVYKDQQKYDEAIQWFKKSINLDPSYGHIIATCYNTLKTYQDRVEFLNELAKNNRTPEDFIAMSKMMNRNKSEESINKEINRWKTHDIVKIIKICKENGIKIILQGYPQKKTINDMLCDIAKANSLPFVDNYHIFNELWKKGDKRKDYFSADGHCNTKGYALMARNIFDKIRQEAVFKFN